MPISTPTRALTPAARRGRRHFLAYFPDGFRDDVYVETERTYRWNAHRDWLTDLDRETFATLLAVVTVFGFIARPRVHMFLKPTVTRAAANAYGVDFEYQSTPRWETYAELLAFARRIRSDQADLGARDMIDAQSFIWVQGSPEYD